ncbi:alanine racemase [Chromatiales bacterium (ex Bugula neritina AB1)]|nr:alanine racemase [Chromatiales bacterium (ex Bugula neritina AB1)]
MSIHIDLAAIRHNLKQVRKAAPDRKIFAVVKADAYGHGAEKILTALEDADALAVAHVAEAVALRQAGRIGPILVMQGFHSDEELALCRRAGLWPVIHNRYQLELIENRKMPDLECWVKFDTGMGRLGFVPELAPTVQRKLRAVGVEVKGYMTHLASADRENDLSTDRQIRAFKAIRWSGKADRSVCNSAALLARNDCPWEWVRPGIMLYGASPFASQSRAADKLGLQPAMRVTAPVTAIRNLKRGDRIGYGGNYECTEPTRVATIGAGYADGYPRAAPGTTSVMLGNWRCPLLGRISMDTMAVDISALPVPPPLDYPVTLWGHAQLGVDEIARNIGTIPYELLCTIRGKRTYLDAPVEGNVRQITANTMID